MEATQKEASRLAQYLDGQQDKLKNYSYHVGQGAPRFVLTVDPVLPADNYAQFVVVAKDTESRGRIGGFLEDGTFR